MQGHEGHRPVLTVALIQVEARASSEHTVYISGPIRWELSHCANGLGRRGMRKAGGSVDGLMTPCSFFKSNLVTLRVTKSECTF